jgi:hypothetical protein
MTRPVFTVEQANRMLPLVSRIADDIVREYARWREQVRAFELATAHSRADLPDPRADELQRIAQRTAADIDGFVGELRRLGVELKGFDGLIDFPGEIDGRPVCLCWRLGEPSVRYWHEVDAGFSGRQPLDSAAA